MPKLKTHKGASKRFTKRPGGTVKCRRAYRNHILTKRSTKQKRNLRAPSRDLKSCDAKLAARMLQGS